jgi:hypothetical protein
MGLTMYELLQQFVSAFFAQIAFGDLGVQNALGILNVALSEKI